jgi:hypothetical protein
MEVDGAKCREMLNQRHKEGWKLVSVCGRVKTYKGEVLATMLSVHVKADAL